MASSDKIVSALDSLTQQLTQMVGFQQAQIKVGEDQARALQDIVSGNITPPPTPKPLSTPVTGVQTPGAPATVPSLLLPQAVANANPQIPTYNIGPGGNATPISGPQPMANGQIPGGIGPAASVPAGYTSQFQAPPGGSLVNQQQAAMLNGNDNDQANQALTMAMLGEHGAPEPIRNMIMGSYGMKRSLEWAQNGSMAGTQQLGKYGWVPDSIASYDPNNPDAGVGGVLGNAANAIQKPLQTALNHPLAAYIGTQGVSNIVGNIDAHAKTATTIGQSFGYSGNPIAGPRGFLGMTNPLANYTSDASREGYAFDMMVQQAEGRLPGTFGAGLTSAQAKSAADVIGNQGFQNNPASLKNITTLSAPTGNAENLMQGLFKPLMNQMPGLDAASIGQFTDSIRNAGASTNQVRMELTTLGQIAQATGQNVNSLATATANAGQTFEAMGSSSLGGSEAATAYQAITGIQGGIQMATQLAQSPFVQGMNMSTYGVLPSAMGDENSGALAGVDTKTIKMLAQATQGLNHNVYRNVDGIRTLISRGSTAQMDQIASMLNIPVNQIKAALDPNAQKGTAARTQLSELIGSAANGGTGMFADLESGGAKGRATFNQDWAKISSHLAGTGISQARLAQIDKIKDPLKRLGTLNNAIAGTEQNPRDKVSQNNKSAGTMKVEFTGAAARWFQTVGSSPTTAKNTANAGGSAYNSIVNLPGGDPGKNLSAAQKSELANDRFTHFTP